MSVTTLIIQSALALTILCDIALLLFLFSKKVRGPIFVLFTVHIIGVLGWAASVLATIRTENATALKLTFFFALLLAVAKYLFADIFPENKLPASWKSYWFLVPVGAMSVIALFDHTIFTGFSIVEGRSAIITNGPFANLYALLITYLLVFPLVVLYKKYKKESDQTTKAQLKYLLFGFSIFFLIGLFTNEILPVYFGIFLFNATGPIFSLVLVAFTFYIITKYHFLDIWIIIQRSLIFAILLASTVGTYLLLVGTIGYLFQKETDSTMLLAAGITMLLGIWGTPVVERVFRRWTDPIFFQDPYDFAEAMRELTVIGNRHIALETIVAESRRVLARVLKSEEVTFYFPPADHTLEKEILMLRDPQGNQEPHSAIMRSNLTYRHATRDRSAREQFLLDHHAEVALPLQLEHKLLGVLLVGKKRSGDPYNKIDIDLLENFAAQIAVAIEKALLYKQVAEYSALLETRVAERTKEVLSLQEEERHMMLEISHGLQTPLTIMKNEVSKLRASDPESPALEHFERSIDKASKFIYDLLHLARLEKTKEADHERVDFSALLEEVVEYFEVVAADRGIAVEAAIAKGGIVWGGNEELTEAVSNLLSNAIKYMRTDGNRTIWITETISGSEVTLSIRDTGVGIPEEQVHRLSERFYRAGSNGSIKGTGLGLAITKRIIEKHHGTLTVTSTEGVGSTFTITLPLLNGEEGVE